MVNRPSLAGEALTARQEAFAQHYVKHRDVANAWRAAYEGAFETQSTAPRYAYSQGWRVLRTEKVRKRVLELSQEATAGVALTVADLLSRYMAIAQADPNELIGLKVGACRHCHGVGHEYQWRLHEYVQAVSDAEARRKPVPSCAGGVDYDHTREPHPDCPECRGEGVTRVVPQDSDRMSPEARLLYAGAKMTKNGLEIQMHDQMKALEMAGRIIGAFNDKLELGGKLQTDTTAQTVTTTYTDPNEAAKAYQDMIARPASGG